MAALLFVYAAALQYNDPDPLRWVALYLSGAALATWRWRSQPPRFAAWGLAAIAAGWGALLVPGIVRAAAWSAERELAGLLLVGVYAALVALRPAAPPVDPSTS